jgi:hypothetical protein
MRNVEDPRRLFEADEAPAELHAWLRQAQQDIPSPAQVDQLVRAVERQMQNPTAAVRGFRSTGTRTTAKVVAALLVVGLGLGGWYMVSRSRSSEPTTPTTPTTIELPTAQSQIPSVPVAAPVPAPAPVAPETADERAPSPTGAKPRHLAHLRSRESDTVHHTPAAAPTPEGSAERAPSDEFALLRAARQAIGDRPDRALALTSEHARLFPSGMLSQEREAIAVEALVKLGRASAAQTRAHAFLAGHPDSPYRSRIEAALARSSGVQRSP